MTEVVRWMLDPDTSSVTIDGASSVHPIRAEATGLRGWIEGTLASDGLAAESAVSGRVAIDVARLASGNPLIDRETRRRIQARRHPQITGEVVSGTVIAEGELLLEGVIEFRGERTQVEGTMAVVDVGSERIVLTGASRFDVRWWGLRPPRLGLLRVYPEIDVTVYVEATRHPDPPSAASSDV